MAPVSVWAPAPGVGVTVRWCAAGGVTSGGSSRGPATVGSTVARRAGGRCMCPRLPSGPSRSRFPEVDTERLGAVPVVGLGVGVAGEVGGDGGEQVQPPVRWVLGDPAGQLDPGRDDV